MSEIELNITGSWELPLEEASALAIRLGAGGGVELVAVDDERHALARGVITAGNVSPRPLRDDVLDAVTNHGLNPGRKSNFEGVASDGSRRLFVLQESVDRILVFTPELDAVTQVISLHVRPNEEGFGADWHADSNARGEGLLLLRNGHILVAKQKEPTRLIEFGPTGSSSAGFKPGDALDVGQTFPLSAGPVRFDVLASWPLATGTPLKSINDLAWDAQGRLYVVSSASRSLARLTVDLLPQRGWSASFEVWKLPADLFAVGDEKAEGLVFSPELGPLVALDLDRSAANLFRIDGVPV